MEGEARREPIPSRSGTWTRFFSTTSMPSRTCRCGVPSEMPRMIASRKSRSTG